MRSKPPLDAHLQHLTVLDQQIASSQQELPKIFALKANIRWQKADETSVKYLKKLYRQRTIEQHITTLPPNISTKPAEGIDRMLPIAQQFFGLYLLLTRSMVIKWNNTLLTFKVCLN